MSPHPQLMGGVASLSRTCSCLRHPERPANVISSSTDADRATRDRSPRPTLRRATDNVRGEQPRAYEIRLVVSICPKRRNINASIRFSAESLGMRPRRAGPSPWTSAYLFRRSRTFQGFTPYRSDIKRSPSALNCGWNLRVEPISSISCRERERPEVEPY